MDRVNLQIKKRSAIDVVYTTAVVLFTALLTVLFYRQSIRFNGKYPSDTNFYATFAKTDDGYRLISHLFRKLYMLTGNTVGMAIYMAIIIAVIIGANYLIFKYLFKTSNVQVPNVVAQACSIAILFTGSIYLPSINPFFYKSCWTTFAWHSPTQHSMMAFGLIAFLAFIKILDNYRSSISKKYWIIVMIASLLATWSKPAYILVMAPAIVICFLIELVRKDQYTIEFKFKKLFMIGVAFVPSGVLMLVLNSLYYGEEGEGSVSFGLNHFLSNGGNFFIPMLCGMLLPVLVFTFNISKFRDIKYIMALLMLLTGTLEWMFIKEEGPRASNGNFSWGKKFGCYIIFLLSIYVAIENFKDKSFLEDRPKLRKAYFVVLIIVLAAMLLSQLYYFYSILRGHTYNW